MQNEVIRINRVLEDFNRLAGAKCNILIDKEGNAITRVGGATSFNEDTLAALVAGSFAATREMARLLGEEEFSLLSHQGMRDHVLLTLIAQRYVLTTMFDETTTVGAIRLYGHEAARQLNGIFRDLVERGLLGDDTDDFDGGSGVFARLRPRKQGPGGAHSAPPPSQ